MRLMLLGSSLLACLSSGSLAQQTTAATPPIIVTHPTGDEGDKIICKRRAAPEVGTRLKNRGKICMRAADWKAQATLTEEAKRRIQDRPSGTIDPNAPAGIGSAGGPE